MSADLEPANVVGPALRIHGHPQYAPDLESKQKFAMTATSRIHAQAGQFVSIPAMVTPVNAMRV